MQQSAVSCLCTLRTLRAIPDCLQGAAINKLIPWFLDGQLYLPHHVSSELISMFYNSLRSVLEHALSLNP